jgi:hypothetical protein
MADGACAGIRAIMPNPAIRTWQQQELRSFAQSVSLCLEWIMRDYDVPEATNNRVFETRSLSEKGTITQYLIGLSGLLNDLTSMSLEALTG